MTKPCNPINLFFTGLVSYALLSCSVPAEENGEATGDPGWEKIGPGGGGSTFMPVFSYENSDNFLVRCDMTGTYLTKDGGQSYQQLNFANGSSAYTYDPADQNTIYIGATVLSRSTDGGVRWKQIFPKPEDVQEKIYRDDHAGFSIKTSDSLYNEAHGSINTIRVDPVNPEAIYFSMGRFFYYTSDGGETWSRKALGFSVDHIYTNSTSAKDEVFIFTSDLLYVFQKQANTFTKVDLPHPMSPAFSFTAGTVANGDQIIFYALHNHAADDRPDDNFGRTELWTSQDKGQTWKPAQNTTIANKQAGIKPSYSMIACAEFDAQQAYLVSNRYEEKKANGDTLYWYGALKTGNGGETWDWVWKGGGGSGQYGVKDGKGVSNLKDAWAEQAFGGEYIRLLDAGVYPKDGNVAVVTDWYRTMKTIDGGKTWNEIYSIQQPDSSFVSRGMDVTTNYGVHFDPFDSSHIAISYTDIGYHHSFNGGESWIRSVEGVPSEWVNTCYWLVFDPLVKNKVWSVWSGLHDFPRGKMTRNPRWKEYGKGGVCVSTDGGKTWKPSNAGMGPDSPATSIVLDPGSPPGNRTLYASVYSKGVFKSTDDGETWALKNQGIEENTAAFELTIQENGNLFLTISPTPMHKNGKQGVDFYSGALYKSTDGAETWTKLHVSDGLLFPNGVDFDPKDPDRIYLACWSDITSSDLVGGNVVRAAGVENKMLDMPGGIFLSEDGGKTWNSIFDEDQYVYDVTVDPYHDGRLYANTFNQAAWRSDDRGKTWKKLKGYDFHWGHRVIVDRNDPEKVYLTTYGSSVWHGTPVVDH